MKMTDALPAAATASVTPAVWIGSLHAYNCGSLVGEWTEATDLDRLREVAAGVLRDGGGEEVALMDYQGFGAMIGEYTQLDRVAAVALAIEEHGEALVRFAAYTGFSDGDDLEEFIERFESAYVGDGWESLKDYAEERFHEVYEVPDDLAPYIDYEAYETTLDHGGFRFVDGHIFSPA
jgi:antirestriction protein